MIWRSSLLEINLKHRVLMTVSAKLIVWAGNKVMRTDVKVNIITNFWIWVNISKGLEYKLQRITTTNGKFNFGFLMWMRPITQKQTLFAFLQLCPKVNFICQRNKTKSTFLLTLHHIERCRCEKQKKHLAWSLEICAFQNAAHKNRIYPFERRQA